MVKTNQDFVDEVKLSSKELENLKILKEMYANDPEFRKKLIQNNLDQHVVDLIHNGFSPDEIKTEFKQGAFLPRTYTNQNNQVVVFTGSGSDYANDQFEQPDRERWTPITNGLEAVTAELGNQTAHAGRIARPALQHPITKWLGVTGLALIKAVLGGGCGNEADTDPIPKIESHPETKTEYENQIAEYEKQITELKNQLNDSQDIPKPELENKDKPIKKTNQQVENKNKEIQAASQKIKEKNQQIQKLGERIAKMYNAALAKEFDPRDTRNLNGTIGFEPNFLEAGLEGSQLHDGRYVEGRVFTSLKDFLNGVPVITELTGRVERGKFFRGEPGEYDMPFAGRLSASLLLDTIDYNPENNEAFSRKILAPGIFSEIKYGNFNGFVQTQIDAKLGGRLLAFYQQDNNSLQVDGKIGVQYRESLRDNSTEFGFGPFAEILGSAHLGKGVILSAKGGINFLDSMTKGQGYEIDSDNLELFGDLAVAWNPSKALQFYASLQGVMNSKGYDDEAKSTPFEDDNYAVGRLETGAHIVPFGSVYKFDKDKRLFTPLGSLYFDLKAFVEQTPYRNFDFGAAAEGGFKF